MWAAEGIACVDSPADGAGVEPAQGGALGEGDHAGGRVDALALGADSEVDGVLVEQGDGDVDDVGAVAGGAVGGEPRGRA